MQDSHARLLLHINGESDMNTCQKAFKEQHLSRMWPSAPWHESQTDAFVLSPDTIGLL